jgi:copper chaperone CopZ
MVTVLGRRLHLLVARYHRIKLDEQKRDWKNRNGAMEKMSEFTLRIENMHCGSCVKRVSQALASTQGLEVKEVRVGAARVRSNSEPAAVDLAMAALAKAGYPARLDE